MVNLTQTKIYQYLNKIYKDLPAKLVSTDFSKYTIPPNLYNIMYLERFKDYRYTLARKIFDDCTAGLILPMNLHDPYDEKDPSLVNSIPNSIFTFGTIDKTTKKFIARVDTSLKSKYTRNKIDNQVNTFSIDPMDFFAFMQAGLIFRTIKTNPMKIANTKILNKELATCFGILLAKPIDQKLSFADRKDYQILLFLCICFFYEALLQEPKEKAIEKTRQMSFLFKEILDAKCKYLENELDMQYTTEDAAKDYFPIDKFIDVIRDQFAGIGTKIDYRNLLSWYTSLYGQHSIIALEDYTSFNLMMSFVELNVGIYNDLVIKKATANQIHNIPKLYLQIL